MTVWVRVPPRLRMEYICDTKRHLICVPYSIENLHKMAEELNIKRCWFHKNHYDIPKKRIEEITMKCRVVSSKEIVEIINTSLQLNGRVAPRIGGWSRFDSWQRYKKQLSYKRLLHHPGTMEIPVRFWTSAQNAPMMEWQTSRSKKPVSERT